MTSTVQLPGNISNNLSALSSITSQLNATQNILATGKKVNSALDNPAAYALSQSLTSRSSTLSSLLDGMSNSIQTIQAASKGASTISSAIDTIKGIVSQATSNSSSTTQAIGTAGTLTGASAFAGATGDKLTITNSSNNTTTQIDVSGATTINDVINAVNSGSGGDYTASIGSNGSLQISAGSSGQGQTFTAAVTNGGTVSATKTTSLFNQGTAVSSTTTGGATQAQLSSYAKQINDVMDSINKTAGDSDYAGVNLLQSGSSMSIKLSEKGSSNETVDGQDLTLTGLGLTKFGSTSSVTLSQISALGASLDTAKSTASDFQTQMSTSLSVIQNREDFSNGMIDILDTGAGNLVNADMNKEAANLQALSTRQSIAQSALSLSNTANQGVLQLLR